VIGPRTVRRAARRIVRRLTGAILVAAAVSLTGGLFSPIRAEAAIGPMPCIGGIFCAATSIGTQPKPGSFDVPSTSLDVPKSIDVHVGSTVINVNRPEFCGDSAVWNCAAVMTSR
jgi:hypothetical protein